MNKLNVAFTNFTNRTRRARRAIGTAAVIGSASLITMQANAADDFSSLVPDLSGVKTSALATYGVIAGVLILLMGGGILLGLLRGRK